MYVLKNRKLLYTSLFRKTQALLLQLFYSRMCHLQSVSAGGFLALFPVPTFAFDVELKLQDGNAEYEKNNTHLKLTRDLKHDILEKLASTLYGFKAYPNDKEIATTAEALVTKLAELFGGSRFRNWVEWVEKQH